MMDTPALWADFKAQIGEAGYGKPKTPVEPQEPEHWYRIGTGWKDGICQGQTGAYQNKEYAIKDCRAGQCVYDWNGNVIHRGTAKKENPYPVPTRLIKYVRGEPLMRGEDVGWVQSELIEAGYDIELDKIFGEKSDGALRAYQAAHGLLVDGKCGQNTRQCMMND